MSSKEFWYEELKTIILYIDKHNKKPSSTDRNKYVKKLYEWIQQQIYNYKHKLALMQDVQIYNTWKELVNNKVYKKYFMSTIELWYDNLKDVKNYIIENNELPTVKNNITLYNWVYKQHKNYKNNEYNMQIAEIYYTWELFMNENMRFFLSKEKEIEGKKEKEWYEMFQDYKDYLIKNCKPPLCTDENAKIRRLSHWIDNQTYDYRNNTKLMENNEIRTKFETYISGLSDLKIMYYDLHKIKQYVDENKKREEEIRKREEEIKKQELYNEWEFFKNNSEYKNNSESKITKELYNLF